MNQQAIILLLREKHNSFINYINELTPDDFQFVYKNKWSAGQQLEHLVLCTKPLLQVFSMDKKTIEQNFGITDRPGISYESLMRKYDEKLKEGGKAPERFVPNAISYEQKEVLTESLRQTISNLCIKIEKFTEEELDQLLIPHPLLGNITFREMMFNAIYHVQHHQQQAKQNLLQKNSNT